MTKTRLAVVADVHGNLPALEAVLADIQRRGVDGIIVAGDMIPGPQPRETIDLLHALDGWLVRGNGDEYVLAFDRGDVPEGWHKSQQWAFTRWSWARLDREALDLIASLPEQQVVALEGTARIRVVHGSPSSSSEHLFPDRDPASLAVFREAGLLRPDREPPGLDTVLARVEEPVLVCAHSHVPWQQEGEGRLVLNPGSVGAPNNGDARAQYALLTWGQGRWRATQQAVAYDLDCIRAAYLQTGLLAEGGAFAQACLLGIETGRNVPGFFLAHVYSLAGQDGWVGGDVVPDPLWEQATATFDWPGR